MKLIAPWASVICPFCFKSFHPGQVARRALSDPGNHVDDNVLGDFLHRTPPRLPRAMHPDRNWLKRLMRRFLIMDDKANQIKRICPSCHIPLPHKMAIGEVPGEFIAILGARNSGKSNFFGVLINRLEKQYRLDVGFSFRSQTTFDTKTLEAVSSSSLYKQRYGDSLFSHQEAIKQTTFDTSLLIPLIYRIECRKRLWQYLNDPLGRVNAANLLIFDTVGEDLSDPTKVDVYRYLLRASGIILLIDPLELPGIRERLDTRIRDRLTPIDQHPYDILTNIINMLEDGLALRPGHRIKVPIALAFTKCDVLNEHPDIVHPGSELLKECHHFQGFNQDRVSRLSDEVQERLRQSDSEHLVQLAAESFATCSFFAISALGHSPDHNMKLRKNISPLRIGDPLLWILFKLGYLPAMPTTV